MRVVHLVCSVGFAGVERYIVNVSSGLVRRGVEVDVIGGHRAAMQEALAGSGVLWHPGDDFAQARRELRALVAPDLTNTHMSQADLVGLAYGMTPRGRRTRQVSTRHFAGGRGGNPLVRGGFTVLQGRFAAELAISQFVAAHAGSRARVVHSGVAVSRESAPRESYALVAQRLEPEKDTALAIEAWGRSAGPARGWALRIAGDGSERRSLEDLVREHGWEGSVEFLGHRDDVPDLLRRAGFVIAPTPREGLGILVLEAMAEGTPVVASSGGGHLETVGLAAPQMLFEPGDVDAAVRIMDTLWDDPARLAEVGNAVQELQRTRFTIDEQVTRTLELYERVLRG